MNFMSKYHKVIFLIIVVLALGLLNKAYGAEVRRGVGIICNTPEQIERVTLHADETGDMQSALDSMNGREIVCGQAEMFFVQGKTIRTLRLKRGYGEIVSILIVGAVVDGQILRVKPEEQFAVFKIEATGI